MLKENEDMTEETNDEGTQGKLESSEEKSFERDKFLWEIIKRIDFYIGTTNTKAAFLITFNTFMLATIVLKYKDWHGFLGDNHHVLEVIGQELLVLISLACIFSLIPTFWTVNPFMRGGGKSSLLFYAHIQTMTALDYATKMQALERVTAIDDLANQAHILSIGVTKKFWLLRVATVCVLIQLVALALLMILKSIAIVLEIVR